MKSIELTEEHKPKLLEMCKKLFPEFKDIDFYSNKDDNGRGFAKEFIYLGNGTKGTGFHWFEFCMTHLARVLMCKNTKHMQQLFMGLKHPVDYLYEEFKKLK